ncbi:hypothetical protein GCM10018771_20070 [Streptomyces cellulosae]|nr:hypothetical protein GCM10018771_20070 [Streptomyces cellulosae]
MASGASSGSAHHPAVQTGTVHRRDARWPCTPWDAPERGFVARAHDASTIGAHGRGHARAANSVLAITEAMAH